MDRFSVSNKYLSNAKFNSCTSKALDKEWDANRWHLVGKNSTPKRWKLLGRPRDCEKKNYKNCD